MIGSMFYVYELAGWSDALAGAKTGPARDAAEAGLARALEAAQAGKLSTAEFTRVQDAILRAIDDDTDEGDGA